jgi:monofunctional biosynthetic peptidoglycan transglycosylase
MTDDPASECSVRIAAAPRSVKRFLDEADKAASRLVFRHALTISRRTRYSYYPHVEQPLDPRDAARPEQPARGRQPASRARRALGIAAQIAEAATIALALGALGLWCSIPRTARLADDNPSSTAFIELRRAQAEAAGTPFKLQWQWRRLAAISRNLRAAVIYAEDYNFYHHDGLDWRAIEHAVTADWNKGAMAVGGSTITQQLAKNLYLSPSRSFVRKLREALIAFSLEDHLTKQRILELYLNVVEWGDGVFGAEAAARAWFHHSAETLSPAEAIRLAIALPNPIARAPNVRDAELTRKGVRLIRMLRMQGLVDAAQERVALDELGAAGERVLPDRSVAAPPPRVDPGSPPAPARSGPVESGVPTAPRAPAEPAPSRTAEPATPAEPARPPGAEPATPAEPVAPAEPAVPLPAATDRPAESTTGSDR